MTYSIIDTRFGETDSTHPTAEAAQAALDAQSTVREWWDGKWETRRTAASLSLRVRNDTTGEWMEWEV